MLRTKEIIARETNLIYVTIKREIPQGVGPSTDTNVLEYDFDGEVRSGNVCDIGMDER